MKTYYLFHSKNRAFYMIGLVAFFAASCGSYQNASYYDNDGVYNSKENVQKKSLEQNTAKSDEYAQQFRDMQDDYAYFTDVDHYQSQEPQDTIVTVYRSDNNNQSYAGWGNNPSNVTINYYDTNWGWNNWYSPYWGYSNWGWNNWYGANWGWGWNSWYGPYAGWNNWYGYGNYGYGPGWNGGYYNNGWGWYGYRGRNVVHNSGPRGGTSYYNSGRRTSPPTNGRRATSFTRTSSPRNSFQNPRSAQNNGSPRAAAAPKTYSPRSTAPRESSTTSPKTNTNSTPRSTNYSTPRSTSSGGSFGGGTSGGGGRSSGGGRGGRG